MSKFSWNFCKFSKNNILKKNIPHKIENFHYVCSSIFFGVRKSCDARKDTSFDLCPAWLKPAILSFIGLECRNHPNHSPNIVFDRFSMRGKKVQNHQIWELIIFMVHSKLGPTVVYLVLSSGGENPIFSIILCNLGVFYQCKFEK